MLRVCPLSKVFGTGLRRVGLLYTAKVCMQQYADWQYPQWLVQIITINITVGPDAKQVRT